MRVKATKTVEYDIKVHHQREDDPDDGMLAGYYACVGNPGQQSDFFYGPHKSAREARVAACEKLRRLGYHVEKARQH